MAGNQTISIYRGEDITLNFTMVPVVDISGWTLEFTLSPRLGAATASKTLTGVVGTVTSGPDGTFTVSLTDTQTEAITPGLYYYDVWRTDGGSERCLAVGKFHVLDQVRVPA